MVQDTVQIKEKILSFLRLKGPSLPVHISGEIKSDILFSSAFLSELVSEKKIKMSNMRVGSSPIYFIPGQEPSLEKFSQHLRSKEKEAYALLREKRFLQDSLQQPAIRVALREIRDFALPFKNEEEIIWRYFTVPENEFKGATKKEEKKEEIKKEMVKEVGRQLDIFKKTAEKKKPRKKSPQKEKFFEQLKDFLTQNSIQMKDIEAFSKNEIILRVDDKGQEKILVAYNKKKITDNDIVKAHNKVASKGLTYMLVSLSEPPKKTLELISAIQNLSSIRGIKR